MTKGIVLISFGELGYYYAAHNLALSIKSFNSKLPITLIHDGKIKEISTRHFNDLIELPKSLSMRNDPAEIKTGVYDLLPYDHNLYLDVDAVVLKDITPLLEDLSKKKGFYLTDVKGVGGKKDVINYSIWATNEDIWEFGNLKDTAKLPAIQSSYAMIKKSKGCEKFFELVQSLYHKGFPMEKLTMRWGGTLPDELLFSTACAKIGLNPQGGQPIFFGWQPVKITKEQIVEAYYLTAIYGNGRGATLVKKQYLNWYDDLVRAYAKKVNDKAYAINYIMRDKHANG